MGASEMPAELRELTTNARGTVRLAGLLHQGLAWRRLLDAAGDAGGGQCGP
ncbi:MAG TPA: hypothetical protein VFU68_04625 [Terracidiphilus sp.]|nr:hypothetical protein [Terracidiphilus sp.]